MPSNRWLKAVNPPQEEASKPEPTPNVSMRDVRRLQQQKSEKTKDSAENTSTEEAATPSRPSRGSRGSAGSVAPERDFTKVANSIVRDALPAGVFAGKRKQLYDYLYSQSRGAVVPQRRVRMSKERLMKGADIGSGVTLRQNLNHLKNAGLVIETIIPGTHGGNEYEVFLPEEIAAEESLTPSRGSRPSRPSSSSQFLEGLDPLETRPSRGGLIVENTDTSAEHQTLYKTIEQIDDEAFAEFVAKVSETAKEITGKEPSKSEATRWGELAEVLMTELRIAAGRTTVSSVPAFLTEHLRRRLWKKEKRQIEAEQKTSSAAPKVDASKCPDCFGTGMYYPEGFDKGVARCEHKRLGEGQSETPENAGGA